MAAAHTQDVHAVAGTKQQNIILSSSCATAAVCRRSSALYAPLRARITFSKHTLRHSSQYVLELSKNKSFVHSSILVSDRTVYPRFASCATIAGDDTGGFYRERYQVDKKIAILIDGDNTPASYTQGLFDEISKYGTPIVKRCYGDFSSPKLRSWKIAALQFAISTEQQFAYTSGKNATDIRLVIDAMDILYSGQYDVDEFFLASSDSDFAPLASRLRMAGKKVYAAGMRTTPQGFRNSVDQFILLETLRASPINDSEQSNLERSAMNRLVPSENYRPSSPSRLASIGTQHQDDDPSDDNEENVMPLLLNVMTDLANTEANMVLAGFSEEDFAIAEQEDWVYLRSLARVLGRRSPGFSARNYGYNSFRDMVEATGMFYIKSISNFPNAQKHVIVKLKQQKVAKHLNPIKGDPSLRAPSTLGGSLLDDL